MNTLNEAIELAKAGKKVEARKLLESLLKTEQRNISAWLWYVDTWPDDLQRIKALELCLKYNPDNQKIHQALNVLRARQGSAAQTTSQVKSLPVEPTRLDENPVSQQTVTAQSTEDTRKCPYCAETIRAEAIVCRFCGRDLKIGLPPTESVNDSATTTTTEKSKRPSLLTLKVEALTKEGWQVTSRTEATAQLRKPKQWDRGCLWFFVILPTLGSFLFPALFGVAVVGLMLTVVTYMLSSEETLYFTEEKLQQERQSRLDEDRRRKEQKAHDEQVRLEKRRERQRQKQLRKERKLAEQVSGQPKLIWGLTAQQMWLAAGAIVIVLAMLTVFIIFAFNQVR